MEANIKHEWSSFTVAIPMNISETDIINAWTTQEGLEKWFLRQAEFFGPDGSHKRRNDKIQPGDTYIWRWYGWPDDIMEQGEILEHSDNEFVRFVFGKAGVVSLRISNQDNETILTLSQESIPDDESSRMNFHVGCKTGWTFYLLNLKSILSGGLDLRNKNNALKMD